MVRHVLAHEPRQEVSKETVVIFPLTSARPKRSEYTKVQLRETDQRTTDAGDAAIKRAANTALCGWGLRRGLLAAVPVLLCRLQGPKLRKTEWRADAAGSLLSSRSDGCL
jgi:hypothetical protein